VKRSFFPVSLAILINGLLPFRLSGPSISIADTSIPDNEIAGSVSKASNSSATATITITWTTASLPDE